MYVRKRSHVDLTVSNLSLAIYGTEDEQYSYRLAGLITNTPYSGSGCFYEEFQNFVGFDGNAGTHSLPLMSPSSWKYAKTQFLVTRDDIYYVYISNCEKDTAVSLTADIQVRGQPTSCITVEAHFTIPLVLAVVYIVLALGWAVILKLRRSRLQSVELVVSVVLAAKIALLAFAVFTSCHSLNFGSPLTYGLVSHFLLVLVGYLAMKHVGDNFKSNVSALASIQSAVYVHCLSTVSGFIVSFVSQAQTWTLVMFAIDSVAALYVLAVLVKTVARAKPDSAPAKLRLSSLVSLSWLYGTCSVLFVVIGIFEHFFNTSLWITMPIIRALGREVAMLVFVVLVLCAGCPAPVTHYQVVSTDEDQASDEDSGVQMAGMNSRRLEEDE